MTSLLNKANRYFSKNVRGKAASAVHEMATQVYGRIADDSRDRSTTLQSLTTDEVTDTEMTELAIAIQRLLIGVCDFGGSEILE
ncbi:hypothetical protein WJX77_006457 [Trebouxia sp. C0004]